MRIYKVITIFKGFVLTDSYFIIFGKVIGDKNGGGTARALRDVNQSGVLEEISQVVQVPMKFIHVTRNPFDNIATMMLRATGSRDAVREEGVKVRKGFSLVDNYANLFL